MSLEKRLYSVSFLGLQTIKHFLKKPFSSPGQKGLKLFLENYASEGLIPLTLDEELALVDYSRCHACRLCDPVCPLRAKAPPAEFPGPSWLPLCVSRSMPAFPLAHDYLAWWEKCGDCRACEEACPMNVPLRRLAGFVRDAGERCLAAQRASTPPPPAR